MEFSDESIGRLVGTHVLGWPLDVSKSWEDGG